ncbi:hypothetical protein KY284_032387 [Solanum tuberosum]|nr:hypothetical protein KY284_032387 [Solanum tuberosum]
MTREERITTMENQKVLNGRVFNPDILTKFEISNLFNALASKREDVKNAGLSKRFLKGKYQLLFEFINKVLVVSRGPSTSDGNEQVLQKLRDENERLLKTNPSPSEEVKALNMQLIKAYEDANEHLSLFMRTLNPFPLPS